MTQAKEAEAADDAATIRTKAAIYDALCELNRASRAVQTARQRVAELEQQLPPDAAAAAQPETLG